MQPQDTPLDRFISALNETVTTGVIPAWYWDDPDAQQATTAYLAVVADNARRYCDAVARAADVLATAIVVMFPGGADIVGATAPNINALIAFEHRYRRQRRRKQRRVRAGN